MKAVKSQRVLLAGAQDLAPAVLIIQDEKIIEVCSRVPDGFVGEVIDFGESALLPGLIDCHVHINEPGRTEWEGYQTATTAALAGGITMVVDMPLNCSPVTTSQEALQVKLEATSGKLHVDTGFWGGAVPQNLDSLDALSKSGVLGVKAFMIDSGLSEFEHLQRDELYEAARILAGTGKPLLVHAEFDGGQNVASGRHVDPRSYLDFESSRPSSWENHAIDILIDICQTFETRVHIVHLSSAEALDKIAEAKAAGLPMTVETCPHYLVLNSETIPDGNTLFKCCPPIRGLANQGALWRGVADGVIDFIVSDHSPCTPQLKMLAEGDFQAAWGGISSLQLTLPLLLAKAKSHGVSVAQLVDKLTRQQAVFLGVADRKGSLREGLDADFGVWDTEESWQVAEKDLWFRHKVTPYLQHEVCGRLQQTWLRGKPAFVDGNVVGAARGQPVLV